ncbi:hypothetical protein GJ496_010576 [Pomphorhynchus laevis]|nr:hypothetical protein GJ496_010576 [Pomphorhynchus laevis]
MHITQWSEDSTDFKREIWPSRFGCDIRQISRRWRLSPQKRVNSVIIYVKCKQLIVSSSSTYTLSQPTSAL